MSFCKNLVYFLNARQANITPTKQTPIQSIIVALQPKRSDIRAIPYIEAAAPIYVQALQKPLTVEALPVFANLPGTQEIKRKLQECINAQTMQARSKQIILQIELLMLINKQRGIQSTMERPKSMQEPLTSLLNTLPLCITRTKNKLIIEKKGKATDTKIELSLLLLKTSIYKVGSQLSMPSRIKPIATMQTKIGSTPLLIKICQRVDFFSTFSILATPVSIFSAFLGKARHIANMKIAPTTIQNIVEVKNTALQDIKEIQRGAYKYKTIVEICAPQVTIRFAVTYFS